MVAQPNDTGGLRAPRVGGLEQGIHRAISPCSQRLDGESGIQGDLGLRGGSQDSEGTREVQGGPRALEGGGTRALSVYLSVYPSVCVSVCVCTSHPCRGRLGCLESSFCQNWGYPDPRGPPAVIIALPWEPARERHPNPHS